MDSTYLLIKGGDDGTEVTALTPQAVQELMADPRGNYGVKTFLPEPPERGSRWDANYWPEGAAILVKAEIVVPVPVTTAYELPR